MASASFLPTINLDDGTLLVTDTSDFVSQGIALIDVNGNIKVTAPNGSVVYQNSSYYFETGTAQSGSTANIQLASGATSLNLAGYYILITGGAGAGQVGRVATYNQSTKLAVFETALGVAVNNTSQYRIVLADNFLAANLTNQTTISLYVNNELQQGTYIVDYVVYNSALGRYYTAQQTIDYTYTLPTVVIDQVDSCTQRIFTSLDFTDYNLQGIAPTSLTRTHTLYYPASLNLSPIVGTSANLYTTNLYNNGTYTTSISSVVSWTLPDGTIVNATLTGQSEKKVNCAWVCDLYCCIKALYNGWQNNIGINDTRATEYFDKWMIAIGIAAMVNDDSYCSNGQKINSYIQDFEKLTNCSRECNCGDEQITLVPNIASLVQSYAANSTTASYLDVTTVVNGATTTFNIGLTPTAIQALTSGNVVTADTNTKVTVTGSGATASFAIKGATVTGGVGVDSVFTGGTTNPDYAVSLKNLLYSLIGGVSTASNSTWETLRSYTLPADYLVNVGDELEIFASYLCAANSSTKQFRIQFNGTTIGSSLSSLGNVNVSRVVMCARVFRVSATEVGFQFVGHVGSALVQDIPPAVSLLSDGSVITYITAADLDSLTNAITFQANSAAIGDITNHIASIEIKKK